MSEGTERRLNEWREGKLRTYVVLTSYAPDLDWECRLTHWWVVENKHAPWMYEEEDRTFEGFGADIDTAINAALDAAMKMGE